MGEVQGNRRHGTGTTGRIERTRRALQRIPPKHRCVLMDDFVRVYSVKQIALRENPVWHGAYPHFRCEATAADGVGGNVLILALQRW